MLLDKTYEWAGRWLKPVIVGMYKRDFRHAQKALDNARSEQALLDLNADERCAAEYATVYTCYTFHKAFDPPEMYEGALRQALELIYSEPAGPASTVMQRIVLVKLLVSGDRLGYQPLGHERLGELLSDVPDGVNDLELWHAVASWAFKHRNVPLLERAYEVFAALPSEFADQYPYIRARLMYDLLTGRATSEDVLRFLDQLQLLNEVLEYEKHIKPRVIEAGLLTPEIEDLAAAIRHRLELLEPRLNA